MFMKASLWGGGGDRKGAYPAMLIILNQLAAPFPPANPAGRHSIGKRPVLDDVGAPAFLRVKHLAQVVAEA